MSNEIIDKVEALRSAGFTPVSILMSKSFHNELCVSQPAMATGKVVMTMLVAYRYYDLPIKLVLGRHETYSIEVQ